MDIDLLGVRVLVVKIGLYWITDHTSASAQQQSQPSPRQIIQGHQENRSKSNQRLLHLNIS